MISRRRTSLELSHRKFGRFRCFRGFTLVELLVVIGIIGLLVGMLLPAVQAAREAGRRASCQNNLRQWGLAFHEYSHSSQAFPSGYRQLAPADTFVPHLLPQLEQANLNYDLLKDWNDPANRSAIQQQLAVMVCPSVPAAQRIDEYWPDLLPAAGDYVGTHGVNHEYCDRAGRPRYTPIDENGTMTEIPCRIAAITDGLSQTFLLLEDAGRPELWRMTRRVPGRSANAGWADPGYAIALDGSDELLTGGGQNLGQCVMNCTNDNEAYSFHPGTVGVLLADGSVRMISQTMQEQVFAALTTRAAMDIVGDEW